MLGQVLTIAWKDILVEARTRVILPSMLVFAVILLVVFNFAFNTEAAVLRPVAGGLLWTAYVFSGLLGLNRVFAAEGDQGCLGGLMLLPVSRTVILWGKFLGSTAYMLVLAIIITPLFLALFNLPLFEPRLALVILMATVGFTSVGTFFAAVALNIRAREVMLPLLLLPFVVPLIIAAVEASAMILAGRPWADFGLWLQIIGGLDVIFLVLTTLLFEYVVEF
jgi:heme exporter protein B